MHPGFRLVRIGNTVVSFAGTGVAAFAARGAGLGAPLDTYLTILAAAASTACVTAGGNVVNDILDRVPDRVNHPDRPLVTGAISVTAAKGLAAGLLVASFVLIVPLLLLVPLLGAIWALAVGSLLAYEFRFKSVGFAGNLLVAWLTAAVFLYGGAAVAAPLVVAPLAAMAFGATLSREVIKDMEDMGGDVDRTTLPRTHGLALSATVARIAVAVAIVLSPVPLLLTVNVASVAGIMYLALVVLTDALFVVSVRYLPDRLHEEQTLSKGAMTVALLAFLALAFR